VAVAAFAGGLVLASGDSDEPSSDGTAPGDAPVADGGGPAPETPACPEEIASSPRRLAGQMLMVRMEATATEALRDRVADGELGGVIVFPPEGTDPAALGREVEVLRAAAERGGAPAPLVATDQEGGDVERLPSLPPNASAPEMAVDGEAAVATQGENTGRALRELGIDVDLAPVLDVPGVDGAFIASRAFSDDPAEVAELGVAFGTGLQAAGVAAAAKHFPGLGLAVENTDLAPSAVDASRAELEPGLEPFSAAIEAGFELVMVGNATYPALDPDEPASQSGRVVDGLLRERLGFDGVVITDDLGAGGITGAGLDEGAAAVGAADAGADVLLIALTDGAAAHDALIAAIRSGDLDRERLLASCARTTALKERLAG
jgi:beta-N-acetylhexosaminidase